MGMLSTNKDQNNLGNLVQLLSMAKIGSYFFLASGISLANNLSTRITVNVYIYL